MQHIHVSFLDVAIIAAAMILVNGVGRIIATKYADTAQGQALGVLL